MGLYLHAKCKLCRRAGEKLFLRGERCFGPKCAIVKRNYPPGAHGQTSNRRLSDYGTQFKEKQKVKKIFGLRERQLKNYYLTAKKFKGNTAATLLRFLELRLDNIVYRLGFAKSRSQARQLVTHRHITLNGKLNNRPSTQVKINNVIAIKENNRKKNAFQNLAEILSKQETPLWLKLNPQDLSGQIISEPTIEESKQNFDANAIVEFYSR